MAITTPDYIIDDLWPLAVPIDNLTPLPGNYRRHNIDKLKGALTKYKQRKSITAQRTGTDAHGYGIGIVTAGNGTWQAAKELGWTHIAATFQDDSDEEALGWALTDNRTHDLGSEDEGLLFDALDRLREHEDLIVTAGYEMSDLLDLANKYTPKRPEPGGEEGGGGTAGEEHEANPLRQPGNPVVQYQIIFSSDEQQQTWFKFVRWLKRTEEGDTVADRLTNFLEGILEGYDE